jgi:hypothetical protein
LPAGYSATFARGLNGKDVSSWFSVGGGAAAPAQPQKAPAEEKKVEAKKEGIIHQLSSFII